jgi:hypothetical protein
MIEKRHEAVLKPEHTRIAGFASIGSSFLAGLWQRAAQIRKAVTPGRDCPHPAGSPDCWPARIGNRTRMGAA